MIPGPYPQPGQPGGAPPAPPTRPERPSSVSIASELWALVVLAQTVAYFAQWSSLTGQGRDQLRQMEQSQGQTMPDWLVPLSVIGAGVLLAVVFAQLVWALRLGVNVLRWLGIFLAAYVVVESVARFFSPTDPQWAMIPTLISGVAALGVIVALSHSDTVTFCSDMATYRKGKKSR